MQILISDRRNGALRPSARPESASARRKQEQGYLEWAENNRPLERDSGGAADSAVAYLDDTDTDTGAEKCKCGKVPPRGVACAPV